MPAFATYLFGVIVLTVGLALGAYYLHVAGIWIAIGVIIVLGLGIMTATSRTKTKDPPAQ
jgi:hypothetical protein